MNYTWKDGPQYVNLYEKNATYGINGVKKAKIIFNIITQHNCKSVFDFGCGQNFLLLKEIKKKFPDICIFGFDVAILENQKNEIVSNEINNNLKVDLVISTDCLEHVPEDELEQCWRIFNNLEPKIIYLIICTRLARVILPDGSNAHKTVKSPDWWANETTKHFKNYNVWNETTDLQRQNNYAFIFLSKKVKS